MKMKCKGVTVVLSAILLTCTLALPALAADDGRFGVRLRALGVIPNDKFDSRLAPIDPKVSADVTPELDLEYFFTRNLSTELILGVTSHTIRAGGDVIGSTWLLPPTLTVKYHPAPHLAVSPYFGVGVNYVIPFSERCNVADDFRIKNSFGWALQAGADMHLGNRWYLNFDLKYLDVDTKMRIGGIEYDLRLDPLVIGAGIGYRF